MAFYSKNYIKILSKQALKLFKNDFWVFKIKNITEKTIFDRKNSFRLRFFRKNSHFFNVFVNFKKLTKKA